MKTKFKLALPIVSAALIATVAAVPFLGGCTKEKPCEETTFNYEEYVRNENLAVVKKDDGKISIKNIVTGETTIKDIKVDWTSSSGIDTLAVFCADGKRGYFNVNSGKIVIEPKYRRAWNFSEGVAAVQMNGYIGFLHPDGKVAIDFKYPYYGNPLSDFIFSNGHCVVADSTGKCGVINLKGEWVIDPVYDNISIFKEYALVKQAGMRAQMQYDGKVINEYVVDAIYKLTYERNEYYENNDGEVCSVSKTVETGMYYYTVGGRMGLMDKNCKRLTEPLYTDITAVTENIFRAQLLDNYSEVILNAKGEVMQ